MRSSMCLRGFSSVTCNILLSELAYLLTTLSSDFVTIRYHLCQNSSPIIFPWHLTSPSQKATLFPRLTTRPSTSYSFPSPWTTFRIWKLDAIVAYQDLVWLDSMPDRPVGVGLGWFTADWPSDKVGMRARQQALSKRVIDTSVGWSWSLDTYHLWATIFHHEQYC